MNLSTKLFTATGSSNKTFAQVLVMAPSSGSFNSLTDLRVTKNNYYVATRLLEHDIHKVSRLSGTLEWTQGEHSSRVDSQNGYRIADIDNGDTKINLTRENAELFIELNDSDGSESSVYEPSGANGKASEPRPNRIIKLPGTSDLVIAISDDPDIEDNCTLWRVSSDGSSVSWARTISKTGTRLVTAGVSCDSSGNIYMSVVDASPADEVLYVIKFNSSGTVQWKENYTRVSEVSGLEFFTNGVCGATAVSPDDTHFYFASGRLLQINTSDGTLDWCSSLGGYRCTGVGFTSDQSLVAFHEDSNNFYASFVDVSDGSEVGNVSKVSSGTTTIDGASAVCRVNGNNVVLSFKEFAGSEIYLVDYTLGSFGTPSLTLDEITLEEVTPISSYFSVTVGGETDLTVTTLAGTTTVETSGFNTPSSYTYTLID